MDKFIHRFVSSRPITKILAYLLNIQQIPGKSLHFYMQRFHDESVQIPDPNEQVTIAIFTNGLIAGVFNTEVYRKYPRTLRELWLKVDNGIQSEDLNCMKREAQATRVSHDFMRKKETGRGDQGPSGGASSSSRDRWSVFDRIDRGKKSIPDFELTLLNTNRSHILVVMEQNHLCRALR